MIKILLTILIYLLSINSYATQVVVPTSWNNGDTVTAAKLNGINNAFANVINGNLDNTNMASGYKLFQVVANLPSPGNQGNVAFLTSNNTLNLDNGSAWVSTVTPSGTLATGDVPYYNGGWQLLSPGAQYLPLISNGITSLPSYQALPPSGMTGSAVTQGTVFYAHSPTAIVGLPPGTSGQFLQTQGVGADALWATITVPPVLSNVVYSWTGSTDNKSFVSSATLTDGASATYNYLADTTNSNTPVILLRSKFTKISGVNTFTIYAMSWENGGFNGQIDVNVSGLNGNTGNTITATSPGTWYNFTIDVSGLTNGTTYDLTVSSSTPTSSGAAFCYLGSIIIFGS